MGWYYYSTGDYERAIRQFQATLALDPAFSEAYRFLADAYALAGRFDEADAAQRKALELTGSSDTTNATVQLRSRLSMAAIIAARRGRGEEAERIVPQMIAAVGRGEQPAYDVATIYALLGKKDEAFHWLDRAIAQHEEYVSGFREDPFLM